MHYHTRTDTIDGLGTWASKGEVESHLENHGRDLGSAYTAHQRKGGLRAQECSCWMGEYLTRKGTA